MVYSSTVYSKHTCKEHTFIHVYSKNTCDSWDAHYNVTRLFHSININWDKTFPRMKYKVKYKYLQKNKFPILLETLKKLVYCGAIKSSLYTHLYTLLSASSSVFSVNINELQLAP